MAKYRKALVVLYFGKFNNYFPLWLKSCEYNMDFDWFIYTDNCLNIDAPPNVHVFQTTFEAIKEKIQSLFDFSISLESPYKLCDYKTAYGEIFQTELMEYDYWGYCDVDTIWGRLNYFYPDELLEKYDKISDTGHFTLYKNNEEMRTAYRSLGSEDCYNYKEVFASADSYAFDEWGQNKGINRILINNGYKVYYSPILFADVCVDTYGLYNTRMRYDIKERKKEECLKEHIVYVFDRGTLIQYSLNGQKIMSNEEAYIHLQKRPMVVEDNLIIDGKCVKESFMICPPNRFIDIVDEISKEFLIKIKDKRIYWHYYKIRYSNLMRKVRKIWMNLKGKG